MVSGSKSGSHASSADDVKDALRDALLLSTDSRGNVFPMFGAMAVFRYLNTFGMAVLDLRLSDVPNVECGRVGMEMPGCLSIWGDECGAQTSFGVRVRAIARLNE